MMMGRQVGTEPQVRGVYNIHLIQPPNLGLKIALPGRKREKVSFRGSSEGATGRSKGARWRIKGVLRERRGI